jgi:hypothetical protein
MTTSYHNTGDKMNTKQMIEYANNNVYNPNDQWMEHIEMIQHFQRIEYHFGTHACAFVWMVCIKHELMERGLSDAYTIHLHPYGIMGYTVWVWSNKSMQTPPYVS